MEVRRGCECASLNFDYPGFVHTVLVDMRARLAASDRPDRIFEVTLAAAKTAGLVGRKRVLDSTPLYDAVATMDTVTLIRSAIRGLLKVADDEFGVGCGPGWSAMTTMPVPGNRSVTTTTTPRGRRWSMLWPGTPTRPLGVLDGGEPASPATDGPARAQDFTLKSARVVLGVTNHLPPGAGPYAG